MSSVELEDFLRDRFNQEFPDENRPMSEEEMEDFLRDSFEREYPSENPSAYVQYRLTNSAFANRIVEFDLVNFGFIDVEAFLTGAFTEYEKYKEIQVDKNPVVFLRRI